MAKCPKCSKEVSVKQFFKSIFLFRRRYFIRCNNCNFYPLNFSFKQKLIDFLGIPIFMFIIGLGPGLMPFIRRIFPEPPLSMLSLGIAGGRFYHLVANYPFFLIGILFIVIWELIFWKKIVKLEATY